MWHEPFLVPRVTYGKSLTGGVLWDRVQKWCKFPRQSQLEAALYMVVEEQPETAGQVIQRGFSGNILTSLTFTNLSLFTSWFSTGCTH